MDVNCTLCESKAISKTVVNGIIINISFAAELIVHPKQRAPVFHGGQFRLRILQATVPLSVLYHL